MASAAHPQPARDPVKLDPKHYSVELENDQTRVVRIKYRGHEKSPMHQHPRGVVVFLSEAHFKFTFPDGKTEELRKKPGEIMAYTEPWEHQPENLSGKEFEAVYVEIIKQRTHDGFPALLNVFMRRVSGLPDTGKEFWLIVWNPAKTCFMAGL